MTAMMTESWTKRQAVYVVADVSVLSLTVPLFSYVDLTFWLEFPCLGSTL